MQFTRDLDRPASQITIPDGQGGCATVGVPKEAAATEEIVPPVIRIPELVRRDRLTKGEMAEVQVQFKHPSKTGLAYDDKKFVQIEEPFYVTSMQVLYGERLVSRYEMTAGLSDNPFLKFKLKFTEEKPIRVVFTNSRGRQFSASTRGGSILNFMGRLSLTASVILIGLLWKIAPGKTLSEMLGSTAADGVVAGSAEPAAGFHNKPASSCPVRLLPPQHYDEWRRSSHARSLRSDDFVRTFSQYLDSVGEQAREDSQSSMACLSCHAPLLKHARAGRQLVRSPVLCWPGKQKN